MELPPQYCARNDSSKQIGPLLYNVDKEHLNVSPETFVTTLRNIHCWGGVGGIHKHTFRKTKVEAKSDDEFMIKLQTRSCGGRGQL